MQLMGGQKKVVSREKELMVHCLDLIIELLIPAWGSKLWIQNVTDLF